MHVTGSPQPSGYLSYLLYQCCLQALAILREQNQDAFFGLLAQNLNKLLPIIYTPTVGDACKQWSTLMQRPQGLYVSIKDKVCCFSAKVCVWALALIESVLASQGCALLCEVLGVESKLETHLRQTLSCPPH